MRTETEIEFYGSDIETTTFEADIVERTDGMTIEIQPQDGSAHYLVVGSKREFWWEGTNNTRTKDRRNVLARWVKLGPRYVGTWVEDGDEFVFAFSLG